MMRWLIAVTVSAIALSGASLEELMRQDHVRVIARLEPAEVIATQRANLVITLATDTWFSGGTRIAPPEIRNAIVLQRQTFAVNATHRESGKTWATQSWTIEIYPQYADDYVVPPLSVELSVADGSGGRASGQVWTEPLQLRAIAPPTPPPATDWVVAPELEVSARWDQPMEELMAGDSRRRTIRIRATNLPAMVLPLPHAEDIAGLGVYPQPVRRDDQTNRGDATATLEYSVDYFCEEPGDYTVPGWQLAWWQPEEKRWHVAEVPATSFSVAPNPNITTSEVAEEDAPASPRWGKRTLVGLGLLAVVYALLRWLGPSVLRGGRWLRQHLIREPHPAARAWRTLDRALRNDDAGAIVTALYHWLDHLPADQRQPTLQAWASAQEEPALASLIDELLQSAYGPDQPAYHSSNALRQAIRQAVKKSSKPLAKDNFAKFDLGKSSSEGFGLNFPI